MNDEAIQDKITTLIKTKSLREYLLGCLKVERTLNSLGNASFLAEKSTQRLKNKIQGCQKIEISLADSLVSHADSYLLLPRLDTLRLKLAMLYAEKLGKEIPEAEPSYGEIRDIILNSLKSCNFKLKLSCLNLTIALLKQALNDPQCKEFMGAFDLLKLFIKEPSYLPNEANLQYISNLGCEANNTHLAKKEDILIIRKMFYGVIRELNKKLLFQDLLTQLLRIIESQNNSPLMQFNIIFITQCLNDIRMEGDDFNQVIVLTYQALEHSNRISIQKFPSAVKRVLKQKTLNDHLIEFAGNFKEKISGQLIHAEISREVRENEQNRMSSSQQEFDIILHFPPSIKNKKIKANFTKSLNDFNKKLEKNITNNSTIALKQLDWRKLGTKLFELKENAGAIASVTKGNLEGFLDTSADRFKEFFKKKPEAHQEENTEIGRDLKASLTQAKEKLLPIKAKLNTWNSIFKPSTRINNANNRSATKQFDINHQTLGLVGRYSEDMKEKFTRLTEQILNDLTSVNNAIKEKRPWFLKYEPNGPSLWHKIFHRGYFSSAFTIKKIKVYLNNDLSVGKVNNCILKQSFLGGLFRFGILRWPWVNAIDFAKSWSEQLSFLDDINQIQKLKNTLEKDRDNEESVLIVIANSGKFLSCQSKINFFLDEFKKYIAAQLRQLEALEQQIDEYLNKAETTLLPFRQNSRGFFTSDKSEFEITSMGDSTVVLKTY